MGCLECVCCLVVFGVGLAGGMVWLEEEGVGIVSGLVGGHL